MIPAAIKKGPALENVRTSLVERIDRIRDACIPKPEVGKLS
jgi:hypothetical protein